jgi:hypothetical protein
MLIRLAKEKGKNCPHDSRFKILLCGICPFFTKCYMNLGFVLEFKLILWASKYMWAQVALRLTEPVDLAAQKIPSQVDSASF